MRVEVTDDAALDIEEIVAFLAERGDVLNAGRIYQRIHEHILTLENFPERVEESAAYPGARELVIKRLPYVAVFYIEAEVVRVAAVMHTRRQQPITRDSKLCASN